MATDRDRRVKELLARALDAPAETRREVLGAVETDPELVDEVLELLAGDDAFLDVSPWKRLELADGLGPTETGLRSRDEAKGDARAPGPQRVGPYRIVRHLASGGMGDVYLAEQSEPVQRVVAIKLIRTARSSRSGAARFRAEQQAMARLAHPNVAKLFDAGTSDEGFPYFVMEFVDGEPVTKFANRHRLGLAQRMRLLLQVCSGVEHAHRRGILHRDLKPGNVLVEKVEGRPTARVIDFGIAKALEEPLTDGTLTHDHQPVGTPAYMSPEALAAEGDLDTRTDVYSLGVLLFELLVGSRPAVGEGPGKDRWRRVLEAGEAPRASARFEALSVAEQRRRATERATSRRELAAVLAGDLGWIAWTALAPQRDDRYGSVHEMAEDLEAWLDRRPVRAHPPSLAYRARKLYDRHRAATVAAIVAVVGTLAGLAGTTVGFVRASDEARRASQEAVRANLEAERAHQEARTAREVSDFLVELFEVADPSQAGGESVTARELLDRGAARIRAELADEPVTRARLMEVMGRVYVSLGLLDPAEDLVRDALEGVRDVEGAEAETAAVLDALGYLLYKRNANVEAAEALEEALDRRRSLLGARHEETARTLARLGDVEEQRGQLDAAHRHLAEALRVQEAVLGPDDVEVAETLSRLSVVARRRGELDDAAGLAERALAIREGVFETDHSEVADSLTALGAVHFHADRSEAAADLHRRALEMRERLFGRDHPDVAQSLVNLAITSDDPDFAVPLLERALGIFERALGPEHPRVANVLGNLAWFPIEDGRFEEAVPLLERAYAISLQPDHDVLARVWHLGNLGRIDLELGREELAETRLRRALEHAAEGPVDDGVWVVREVLAPLARLLRRTGRAEEAEPFVRRWEAATGESFED